MAKTIGSEIENFETKVKTADDAQKAAVAADQAATDAVADRDTEKGVLTTALTRTGPITRAAGDGSFVTYTVTTSSAGPQLSEQVSKGVDTPIEDVPPPVPDQPAPPEPGNPQGGPPDGGSPGVGSPDPAAPAPSGMDPSNPAVFHNPPIS